MKLLALLSLIFLAATAQAGKRTQICQFAYHQDIFNADLRLIVEQNWDGTSVLWMDSPTPYGIRPVNFDVTKFNCTLAGDFSLEAKSPANEQRVSFSSPKPNTSGTLTYLNSQNLPQTEWAMTCNAALVAQVCR